MKFKNLERVGNKLRIIDQTSLPEELIYLEFDDYKGIIDAIKCLKVRGAPAIGITAAYGLAVAMQQRGELDIKYLEKVASEFKNARPTAVNLAWAVERVVAHVKTVKTSKVNGLTTLWKEAEAIHQEDAALCRAIGQNGAELINDGDNVLTHCNAGALATGGIGTALGVIYTCHQQGKKLKVYADETRPLLQGARLTTWELMWEGIDVTLICDNTAGMLMHQGKIDHVIVGADRIAKNGDVANKIGTYSVAVLAEKNRVPFYVAAPYSTFDNDIKRGEDIIIEERASEEVTEGFGKRTAPTGVKVYSPAFDITPRELVSFYITDKGVKPGGRRP